MFYVHYTLYSLDKHLVDIKKINNVKHKMVSPDSEKPMLLIGSNEVRKPSANRDLK